MDEIEYIESIDANFPYNNEKQWRSIIIQGIKISDNASYMALYEICCGITETSKSNLLKILEYWNRNYSHPAKHIVMEAANAIINGEHLEEKKAIDYLEELSKYKNLYNAINIIYDAGKEDNIKIKDKHEEIIYKWKSS